MKKPAPLGTLAGIVALLFCQVLVPISLAKVDNSAPLQKPPQQQSQSSRNEGAEALRQRLEEMQLKMAKLHSKGEDREAITVAKQILEIRKQVFGVNDPGNAATLTTLGDLLRSQADLPTADIAYSQALHCLDSFGPDYPGRGSILLNQGLMCIDAGDYGRAEQLLESAVRILKRNLGELHWRYAVALNSQGLLYRQLGQLDRSQALHLRAANILRKTSGEESVLYASTLGDLADIERDRGANDRAESGYKLVVAILRLSRTKHAPSYAVALNTLANFYREQGAYEKAEPLALEAAETAKRELGEKHPGYAVMLGGVGRLRLAKGKLNEANSDLQESSDILKQSVGDQHPDYASSLQYLGELAMQRQEYAKAETILKDALAIDERRLGDKHPKLIPILKAYAELLHKAGRQNTSLAMLARANEISTRQHSKDSPSTKSSTGISSP